MEPLDPTERGAGQSPGDLPDQPPSPLPGQFPPPPEDEAQPSGQPGAFPARPAGNYPMDMSRIFELTFSLFRYGWRAYLVATLVVGIPVGLLLAGTTFVTSDDSMDWYGQIQALLQGETTQLPTTTALAALGFGLVIGAVAAIFTYIAEAAVTHLASESFLGRSSTAGQSLAFATRRLATLAVAYLLSFLLSIGISVVGFGLATGLFLMSFSDGRLTPGPGVFIGLLAFVATLVLLIFVMIRLSMVVPVIVLEGVGAIAALRRSWVVVSGSTWRVLGYIVVFGIIFGLIGFIFTFVLTAIINPASLSVRTAPILLDPTRLAILSFGSAVTSAILMPFTAIGMMLLYLDLRWRRGEPVAQPGGAVADRPTS